MFRKTFISWLFSKDKKPLYVNTVNGHVLEGDTSGLKPDGSIAHLERTPNGWKDVLVKYARNTKYMGLTRDMTVTMKFVGDGAKILRNRMWLFGVECVCYFALDKLDKLNFPPKYSPWYLCELDFSKFRQTKTEVSINAMEGGPSKYLKANESKVYEIPLDTDAEKIKVYLDGQDFQYRAEFIVSPNSSNIITPQDFEDHLVDLTLVNTEAGTYGDIYPVPYYPVANVNSTIRGTGKYFYKAGIPGDATIDYGGITVLINSANPLAIDPSVHLKVVVRSIDASNATVWEEVLLDKTVAGGMLGSHVLTGSFTKTLTAGEELYFYTFATPTLANSSQITSEYQGSDPFFKVQYANRVAPTYTDGMYWYRLGQLLTEKMTDGKYQFKSSWLETKKDDAITCGDALRGQKSNGGDAVLDYTVIKTSFSDFFKSLTGEYSIGCGVEGDYIVVELLSYFFKTTKITDLGDISNLEVTPADEFLYNNIKAGYKEQEYKDVNGKYEVNQGQKWSLPQISNSKELDLSIPYRTDPIGIELLRMNFGSKKTTDTASDNDTFILKIETDIDTGLDPDAYRLYRDTYVSSTGLLNSDNAYNVPFRPKQTLINNGAFLHSISDLLDIEKIKLISADKNSKLVTNIGGTVLTENEDIQIGSLPAKLFRPYFFNFRTMVPINYLELMKLDTYGLIYFTYKGVQYNGFMWDGGIKPGDNDVQTWTLLCGPDVDLTKLIDNA